jgi:ABC-2 type transport system permease protein
VIVGKFLAAWLFIAVALGLTFPMVLTVLYLGNPDLGTIFCGYIGSLLMAGAFLGIGSMTSSLTRSQVISFILAVVLCLFFILSGYAPVTGALSGWAPTWLVDMVAQLGVLTHFTAISRGIIDLRDILYFFSMILFMLFVNGIVILNRRTA